MKLILSGGGDSEHFRALDAYFISQLSEQPNLLFIPLAGDPRTFKGSFERIQSVFSTVKFDFIETCLDLSELDWEYLCGFDAVYIDGGNTFRLMSEIRGTHFYEMLYRFLHHGGVVYGDSAGAIIMGSHLKTAHFGDIGDKNKSQVISYQGLNLMGPWAVHCHFHEDDTNEIKDFVEEYGFPVLALPEEAGISIFNGQVEVLTEAGCTFFNGREVIEVGPGRALPLKII